ncbi:hypothetical protein L3Q82_004004 [Scortum barcoo]|uniref:Uncharacterized protein n=1 Tax=Scortum barcoo TaxID=214431 RepID=A0ACB8X5X0_9TELE|nr:hypothetical protein L3Q82_004004 [Scortum barcoo]
MELEAVQAKIKVLEISLEYSRCQSSEGMIANGAGNTTRTEARDQSGSGGEFYVLEGLKEDVLSVIEFTNRAIHKALCTDLQDKEEAMLALSVQWSFKDVNEVWQEMSLHDNYLLEDAYVKKQVFVDLTMPSGKKMKVNLKTRQVTDCESGATYELKRCDSETVLELPAHWEPMQDEFYKKVELKSNSSEYKGIAQGFLNTAKNNICKIERVQNYYLWNAYSVCSLYGKGVYFAVNAKYSADHYSPADASGLKRLYVAHVLTGRYTVGQPSLKAPPPRGSDPTDRFDSVVDKQQSPSMFVIFHDDQAYPAYLITFK